MKIRQTSVCHTCRSRKLACDGKRPGCSQCVLRGRQCAGYKHDFIFVSQSSAAGGPPEPFRHSRRIPRSATKRNPSPRSPDISVGSLPKCAPDLRPSTWDLVIHVLAKEYAPDLRLFSSLYVSYAPEDCLCGMWVNMLHDLPRSAAHEPVVTAALTALGATILSRGPRKTLSEHQRVDLHISALQLLTEGLRVSSKTFSPELGVAIMCLTMAEKLSPTFSTAWMIHGSGAAGLLRSSGPENFVSGASHTVFLACRAMSIYQAFFSRRATFVAYHKWQTLPFSVHPPSEMHQLLGVVAHIPALLEQLDVLKASSNLIDLSAARSLRECFITAFIALEKWTQEFHLRHRHASPLYWLSKDHPATPRPPQPFPRTSCATINNVIDAAKDENKDCDGGSIWFHTILTASVITHIWTFRVILLTSLLALDGIISASSSSSSFWHIAPTALTNSISSSPSADDSSSPSSSSSSAAAADTSTTTTSTTATNSLPQLHHLLTHAPTTRANILRLALRIRQSMPYYMQPGVGFYGLCAAVFPLKTAHEAYVFLASPSSPTASSGCVIVHDNNSELAQQQQWEAGEGIGACKGVMCELEDHGYPYAALFDG